MSRSQHRTAVRPYPATRPRVITATALGAGAVLALSACSTGQEAETSSQVAAVDGAHGSTRQVDVRDMRLSFPDGKSFYSAGSAAPLEGGLVNASASSDRLVQVTSPYATSAQISGTTELPSKTNLWATGRGSGQPEIQQQGPSAQGKQSDRREVEITLQGLNRDVRPGVSVPVTFVFEKSGSTTIQAPLATSPQDRPEHGSPHSDG